MALNEKEIYFIADKIVNTLIRKGLIQLKKDKPVIVDFVKQTLEQDAQREKEIDQKTLLYIENYKEQIKQENIDQAKFFQMIKRKIAEREGFVL
ncbi:MAG: DUF507 family protein [Desulfurella sp.]|jgi:hypothetical protein|uniref:DUF507 domain-containing protein n=2 Tax=Desulfurella TaxID=33001 RepID=A0A1G6MN49_9BACT|nr:MAG: DUF507 domain-containing protein [Desulfurella multipotens]SDC57008.1 hypothetical protein SAMN05660835_01044 [Desulfurella multipotens]HEX14035.1 DUF507 family protein [Desulfurella acetivorans]